MALIADGVLDPTPMFTGECALEDVPALYERAAAGDAETVKVLVRTSREEMG
jgi:threonine dehydrogenase-like Zn-dependent dehydrogenase